MERQSFSVIEVVKESYASLWENRGDWLNIGLLPLGLSVAANFFLAFLLSHALINENPIWNLAQFVISTTLPSALFCILVAVRGYRYVLLGEKPRSFFSFEWNRIHWKTSLYMLFLVAAGTLISVVGGRIIVPYLSARVSLSYPALALGRSEPLTESWQKTQGNGFKILGVQLLMVIPFILISMAGILFLLQDPPISFEEKNRFFGYIFQVLSEIIGCSTYALLVQATALIYKKLD